MKIYIEIAENNFAGYHVADVDSFSLRNTHGWQQYRLCWLFLAWLISRRLCRYLCLFGPCYSGGVLVLPALCCATVNAILVITQLFALQRIRCVWFHMLLEPCGTS